jgi:uncharacterized membrane protein YdjX (TVP38/TMEM64 family)
MTGSPRPRRLRLLLALAAATGAAVAGAVLLHAVAPPIFLDRDSLLAFLERQGPWAPLALMGLQAAQVVLAPIPGHLLGVVSGYAFGPWLGAAYTAAGVGAGSAAVMGLSRALGRPLVERLAPRSAIDRIDRLAARRGPVFFLLFFFVPFVPDDLACFAVGLSSLPLIPMVALVIAARLPGHLVAAWIGHSATRLPWAGWIALAALGGLLFALYWRYRGPIEAWMLARIERSDEHARRTTGTQPGEGVADDERAH